MVPASVHSEVRLALLPDPAKRFLNTLSSLDADRVAELLCEDARLSTRRGLHAAGKAKIRKELMRWISSLDSIHCEPAVVYVKDDVSVIEADVTCERTDGSRAAFPVTLILRFREHLISDIRLFTYEPAVIGNFRLGSSSDDWLRPATAAKPPRSWPTRGTLSSPFPCHSPPTRARRRADASSDTG
jgi:ketosteroid isomerase-like protein